MKKVKICLLLLMAGLVLGGTAWAFNVDDHVKVAPNGKGDLIVFPWYVALPGGYETKMSVINTSNTESAVAKVVFRSYVWSDELLDFLIYLSPNDVWTGYLTAGINGVSINSTDDSILARSPAASGVVEADFASEANPVSQLLFTPACTGDSNTFGYIEVIEAAATTELTKISGTNKVAKTTIYNWYNPLTASAIINTDSPANILTGYQEFSNVHSGLATLKRVAVFADWDNQAKLTATTVTGLTAASNNTIGELEAAMAKFDVSMPYINKANGDVAIHIFNFPTKLSLENPQSECEEYAAFSGSPYFSYYGDKCEDYYPGVYDLMENTPSVSGSPFSGGDSTTYPEMCNEIELVSTVIAGDLFREGWIRYNWEHTAAIKSFTTKEPGPGTYIGTPVLPSVLYFKANAWAEADAAYTDGDVTLGTGTTAVAVPYYQYSE